MHSYTCKGIILNTSILFEKDRRIEVFTQEFGKRDFIIKGDFQSSKFSGCDISSYISIIAQRKASIHFVKSIDFIEHYFKLRSNPKSLSLALQCITLLRKSTEPEQINQLLFNLLEKTLESLEKERAFPDKFHEKVSHEFQISFLKHEGISDKDRTFQAIFEKYTDKTL